MAASYEYFTRTFIVQVSTFLICLQNFSNQLQRYIWIISNIQMPHPLLIVQGCYYLTKSQSRWTSLSLLCAKFDSNGDYFLKTSYVDYFRDFILCEDISQPCAVCWSRCQNGSWDWFSFLCGKDWLKLKRTNIHSTTASIWKAYICDPLSDYSEAKQNHSFLVIAKSFQRWSWEAELILLWKCTPCVCSAREKVFLVKVKVEKNIFAFELILLNENAPRVCKMLERESTFGVKSESESERLNLSY